MSRLIGSAISFQPSRAAFDATVAVEDARTTAWVAAVVTAGGTVSATQRGYVDTLLAGLRADSLDTILDRMFLFAGESVSQQALIDIINLGTLTSSAYPTLAAGGYTSNGTTQYLDTGFVPSTAGGNYAQDSAHIGVYDRTSRGSDLNGCAMGAVSTGSAYVFMSPLNAGGLQYEVNGGTFPTGTNTNAQGSFIATRTANNAQAGYRNGTSVGTNGGGSISHMDRSLYIFGYNTGVGVAANTTDQLAAAWFGSEVDATQAANLSSRINTYMTAWGVHVY